MTQDTIEPWEKALLSGENVVITFDAPPERSLPPHLGDVAESSMLSLDHEVMAVEEVYAGLRDWATTSRDGLLTLLKTCNTYSLIDLFLPAAWEAFHRHLYAIFRHYQRDAAMWRILLSFWARVLLSDTIPLEENVKPVLSILTNNDMIVDGAVCSASLQDPSWLGAIYFVSFFTLSRAHLYAHNSQTRLLMTFLLTVCGKTWCLEEEAKDGLMRFIFDVTGLSRMVQELNNSGASGEGTSEEQTTLWQLCVLVDPENRLLKRTMRYRAHQALFLTMVPSSQAFLGHVNEAFARTKRAKGRDATSRHATTKQKQKPILITSAHWQALQMCHQRATLEMLHALLDKSGSLRA